MLESFLNFVGLASQSSVLALQAELSQKEEGLREVERKLEQSESKRAELGNVIRGHLATAEGLRKEKTSLERSVLELRDKLADVIKAQDISSKIREWCALKLALPAHYPPVPQTFVANTLHSLRMCLNKQNAAFDDSCTMSSFQSPAAWGLYWVLANAVKTICPHIAAGRTNEDWLTSCLLQEIKQEAKRLESFKTKASLEISTSPIYASVKRTADDRTVTERQVGADILLMLAGKDLVPNEGIRIFWVQAKRNNEDSDPYVLNYWRQAAGEEKYPSKLRQYEIIQGRHRPDKGEFALYMMYSPELSVLPTIPVSKIQFAPHTATRSQCEADLAQDGERLQEFLVRWATDGAMETGQFSTSGLTAHLSEVTKSSGIPHHLVQVHPAGDGRAQAQLQEVSEAYQAALGIKTELVQTREREQERVQELALQRDNSPGLSI